MFKRDEVWEFIQILVQKKRDALGGVIAIVIGLFGNLPFILEAVLVVVVFFLLSGIFQEAKAIQKTYKEKHFPMVIVAGTTHEEFNSTVFSVLEVMKQYRFEEKDYLEDFDFSREDWTVFREGSLRESKEWENLVHVFEKKIIRASEKLKGKKIFHIFFRGPSILAMGMGAIIGTKCELVLHQHTPGAGSNLYQPLIDFYSMCDSSTEGTHTLKSRVDTPYEYITVEGNVSEPSSVWISIWLSSHDPKGDVEKAVEKISDPVSVLHLRSKYGGTLPTTIDWTKISKEVVTEILNTVSRKDVKDVKICLSSPAIIAFALGMAVGTHSPVTLNNWFGSEYVPVLQLNKLRDFNIS